MAMAFPWRKVKSRKISQFVNDHLHNSRKRRDGSSLVVETGFPTSLVDLFMKNREKLKKPLNNRRNDSKPSIDDDAIAVDPVSCEITPAIRSSVASDAGNEIVEVGVVNDEIRVMVEGCNGYSGSNIMVIFKLFLVLFFVLGTNRLTMGITISAFILFVLDYFENRILSSYSRAKVLFWWLPDNQNCGEDLVQEMDRGLTEPEIVETSDDSTIVVEEIQAETACSSSQHDDLLEQQQHPMSKKSSKRAKVKSKLKKFFANRFKARKLKMLVSQTENENKLPSQAVTGLPCISSSSFREEDIDPTVASVDESIRSSKVDQAGTELQDNS